jgi:hypothetical protein
MRKTFVALSVVQVLGSPLAWAQETSGPFPSPLAQVLSGPAKDAFDAAQILVDRSDFAEAYSKFAQAYDLSSDPRLLFNMALCEGRLHDYARMKRLLARYEREGGPTLSDEDRQRVGEALTKIESVVGTVQLAVSEAGSSVLVDGELAGTTPLPEGLILNAGDHTLSVQKPGFLPVTRPLNITGGTATTMAVELSPQARDARLVLATDEAAIVVVDGQTVSRGRFDGVLSPGVHDLRVRAVGKVGYHARVDLHEGDTRTILVTLRDERHPRDLWPWIVGGAVVTAGAVAGGYFLLKSPDRSPEATPAGAGPFPTVSFNSLRQW